MTRKNGFGILFYKPMDEKILSVFPPIVLQYDVKEKYRLISRKFAGMKLFQPSVRLIFHPNRSISVRLLFLICSRVFISRSYGNRSSELVGPRRVLGVQVVGTAEKEWVNRVFSLSDSNLRYSPLTENLEKPSSVHFRYLRMLDYIRHVLVCYTAVFRVIFSGEERCVTTLKTAL